MTICHVRYQLPPRWCTMWCCQSRCAVSFNFAHISKELWPLSRFAFLLSCFRHPCTKVAIGYVKKFQWKKHCPVPSDYNKETVSQPNHNVKYMQFPRKWKNSVSSHYFWWKGSNPSRILFPDNVCAQNSGLQDSPAPSQVVMKPGWVF